jgi:hypothetical protein
LRQRFALKNETGPQRSEMLPLPGLNYSPVPQAWWTPMRSPGSRNRGIETDPRTNLKLVIDSHRMRIVSAVDNPAGWCSTLLNV